MFGPDELRSLLLSFPGIGSIRSLHPVSGGYSGAQVWKCETTDGLTGALKCWPTSLTEPRLTEIHAVMRSVQAMTAVPRIMPTRSGGSFVRHHDRLWDYTEWKPGEPDHSDQASDGRLRTALATLQTVHAILGRTAAPGPIPVIGRRLDLLRDLKGLSHQSLDYPPLVRPWVDRLFNLLPVVDARLRPWAATIRPVQMCLRDIHRDHVLFSGDTVSGLIDFGACRLDVPEADVARLLGDLRPFDSDSLRLVLAATPYDIALIETLIATAPACNLGGWLLRLSSNRLPKVGESVLEARLGRLLRQLDAGESFPNRVEPR